jgi:hypothetical protein
MCLKWCPKIVISCQKQARSFLLYVCLSYKNFTVHSPQYYEVPPRAGTRLLHLIFRRALSLSMSAMSSIKSISMWFSSSFWVSSSDGHTLYFFLDYVSWQSYIWEYLFVSQISSCCDNSECSSIICTRDVPVIALCSQNVLANVCSCIHALDCDSHFCLGMVWTNTGQP